MSPRPLLVLGLVVLAPLACKQKLTEEQCGHLVGRGVGLAAYAGSAVVPVDVVDLRKRARGDSKRALDEFDKACVGAEAGDQVSCGRRANNEAEFVACGPMTKKARETGDALKLIVIKRHTGEECTKLGEHAVKIGATTVDDVGKLVHECDGWMEAGLYLCRLGAKDKAAFVACADK